MIKLLNIILVFCCFFASHGSAFAQADSLPQVQSRSQLLDELLGELEQASEAGLHNLALLDKKIDIRHELIETLNAEIKLFDADIQTKRLSLTSLQSNLKLLLKEYEKLLYYSYRNKGYKQALMFILASKDFNQAYKRYRYLQMYAGYRRSQLDKITLAKASIDSSLLELSRRKQFRLRLLESRKLEQVFLQKERAKQQKIVRVLAQKRGTIRAQIAERELQMADLQRSIDRNLRVAASVKNGTAAPVLVLPVDKNLQVATAAFAAAKGNLLPPVMGVVVSKFGKHRHKLFEELQVQNNGIDLLTHKGSYANAVFDGLVSKVIVIPGLNKSIILKHGDYYSVYSNLSRVLVRVGEPVAAGQRLGRVFTDKDKKTTILSFQLWKKRHKLNPELWIKKN